MTLKSKFVTAAVLSSALALGGCGDQRVMICGTDERAAFGSSHDPSSIELYPQSRAHPVTEDEPVNRPVFSSQGIYKEDEVKKMALAYCLNGDTPSL